MPTIPTISRSFQGLSTALITPFMASSPSASDPAIDWKAFEALVQFQIDQGIRAVIIGGSTGEGLALRLTEHLDLLRLALRLCAPHSTAVIGSVATAHTTEGAERALGMASLGVVGVMAVVPYYVKPSPQGLLEHFTRLADAVALGSPSCILMPYLNPGRSGVSLTPEGVLRLARHPRIRAFKDAHGSIDFAQAVHQLRLQQPEVPSFEWLSGDDSSFFPLFRLGLVSGVVSVASNLIPKEMQGLMKEVERTPGGEGLPEAYTNRFWPFLKTLAQTDVNPLPIKALAAARWGFAPDLRLPLCSLPEASAASLKKAWDIFQAPP